MNKLIHHEIKEERMRVNYVQKYFNRWFHTEISADPQQTGSDPQEETGSAYVSDLINIHYSPYLFSIGIFKNRNSRNNM